MQRTQEERACQTQVWPLCQTIYIHSTKTTLAQPGGSGNLLLTFVNKEILVSFQAKLISRKKLKVGKGAHEPKA